MPLLRSFENRYVADNKPPVIRVRASTGRAHCKYCKEKIVKDTAQLQIGFKSRWGFKYDNYHLTCVIKVGKDFLSEEDKRHLVEIRNWRTVMQG